MWCRASVPTQDSLRDFGVQEVEGLVGPALFEPSLALPPGRPPGALLRLLVLRVLGLRLRQDLLDAAEGTRRPRLGL